MKKNSNNHNDVIQEHDNDELDNNFMLDLGEVSDEDGGDDVNDNSTLKSGVERCATVGA